MNSQQMKDPFNMVSNIHLDDPKLHFFISFFFFIKLVKLAKKLKKEKVNVDIVNFGEEVLLLLV